MGSTPHVRKARPADAEAVARVYVDAWRDTYPLILPSRVLLGMSVEGQCARWRNAIAIAAREVVYVAETGNGTIGGFGALTAIVCLAILALVIRYLIARRKGDRRNG